jgi:hypothetical protein
MVVGPENSQTNTPAYRREECNAISRNRAVKANWLTISVDAQAQARNESGEPGTLPEFRPRLRARDRCVRGSESDDLSSKHELKAS